MSEFDEEFVVVTADQILDNGILVYGDSAFTLFYDIAEVLFGS